MLKKVALLAIPASLALLLTACVGGEQNPAPAGNTNLTPLAVSSSFQTVSVDPVDLPPEITNTASPVITDVTSSSFTITQAGSSTCQNLIEQIQVDNESNHVKLTYESLGQEQACTDDLQIQSWDVTLNDVTIANPDEVLFDVVQKYPAVIYDVTIIGNDGEVRLSGVQPHSHDEGEDHAHEEGHSHEGHTHEEDGHTHDEHDTHSHE